MSNKPRQSFLTILGYDDICIRSDQTEGREGKLTVVRVVVYEKHARHLGVL